MRLRYAGPPHRYAPEEIRYAGLGFRYAAERLCYATAGLRYATGRFRYAAGRLRYAGMGFRYAARQSRLKFARPRADGMGMLLPAQPMSNTERQRRFRQSHPGYYARLNARRRAASRPAPVEVIAMAQAAAAAMAMPAVGRDERPAVGEDSVR